MKTAFMFGVLFAIICYFVCIVFDDERPGKAITWGFVYFLDSWHGMRHAKGYSE